MIAGIAIANAVYAMDKPYSYRVPQSLSLSLGQRVTVPFGFGNTRTEGLVLSLEEGDREGLKNVEGVLEAEPLLSDTQLRLAAFLRERYFCTFYDAVRAILPAGYWFREKETVSLTEDRSWETASIRKEGAKEVLIYLRDQGGGCRESALGAVIPEEDRRREVLGYLVRKKWIQAEKEFTRKGGDKLERIALLAVPAEEAMAFAASRPKGAAMQRSVLELLCSVGSASVKDICYYTGASVDTVSRLEKRGFLAFAQRKVLRCREIVPAPVQKPLVLGQEQAAVFEILKSQMGRETPGVALLYGVTGSGKTSVYIKAIEETLSRGKAAVLLVPEIALTPQLLGLMAAWFGDQVAVLHSSLSPGERYDQWRRVQEGKANLVVGTRSAVFAPCARLGLMILDEEQEHTYKSENTPRYHAREVALYRGLRAGALVVFGSATPSVETMYHAKCGDLALYTLKERFNRQAMPRVELVDLKQELRQGNAGIVSAALEERLRDTVIRGDQAILFLNRRGNSRCLVCVDCGDAPSCPRCSVYLTYHSVTNRLMCHYCGYSEPVTERCPHCGGALRPVGAGTQKVEEELRYEFPDTGILRMDADTVTAANSHEAILERFRRKEASILVGTQMVAKGLDFASVTLAGVLDADLSLYVNHYRAAETTFSLVTQLVGRSGRGADTGTAVIQTMCPEHPVLKLAAAQDYDGFYDMEIALRELRNVPPFRDLFTVTFTGLFEEHVRTAAKRFRDALAMNLRQSPYAGMEFDLLGPAPAAIAKVNYTYRYRATLSCKNTKEIRALLRFLLGAFAKDKQNKGVSAFVDVNAYD